MENFAAIWEELLNIWNFELFNSEGQVVRLNQLVIAFLVLSIGVLISKRISVVLSRTISRKAQLHKNTAHVIQRVCFYISSVIIVLIALPIAGIPITVFTVMGGAVAIGLGFGAQNLFNNLISGLILMIERPIRIGDIVELEGREGRVEEISNRCTRVRRSDGIDLLVPNSIFLENVVINWTLLDGDVRGIVSVGVAYGSPCDLVKDLLMQAAIEHPKVLKDPPPEILFQEFGDNALVFEVWFWTSVTRPMDLRKIQSDLRFAIDRLFRTADITIAFPQRDIHLDTLKPLQIELKKPQS